MVCVYFWITTFPDAFLQHLVLHLSNNWGSSNLWLDSYPLFVEEIGSIIESQHLGWNLGVKHWLGTTAELNLLAVKDWPGILRNSSWNMRTEHLWTVRFLFSDARLIGFFKSGNRFGGFLAISHGQAAQMIVSVYGSNQFHCLQSCLGFTVLLIIWILIISIIEYNEIKGHYHCHYH